MTTNPLILTDLITRLKTDQVESSAELSAVRAERDRAHRACEQMGARIAELEAALEMVRDADDDRRKDGLPTMPDIARAAIDRVLLA
jgi:hypothetical protein